MDKKNPDSEIDISLITQAAVGYVRDNTPSKKAAEKFVAEVRVHLGQILAHMDSATASPLGNKATPEAVALMEYVVNKMDKLEHEKGYAPAQASAIVLKDELVPLQMLAGMANDSDMIASVRKVNSQLITDLGNLTPVQDPRLTMKRKKRGRAPGSGKKQQETKKPE